MRLERHRARGRGPTAGCGPGGGPFRERSVAHLLLSARDERRLSGERSRTSSRRGRRRRLRRAAGDPAPRPLLDVMDITLIDRRNHHLFQPLLFQVATGILSPGQISPVLRHMLRKQENVRVVLSTVTAFDLERRVVHAMSLPGRTDEYPYDSLIVAAGAGQSYFGHDEFAMIAPGMKTIDDAMELRRRVYGALELAETMADPALQRFFTTFVIAGAGPTGVELAGQIRELAARQLDPRLPHHRPEGRPGHPGRRRQGATGELRRQSLGASSRPVGEDGGRTAHGAAGSSGSTRSASTPKDPTARRPGSSAPPSSGPPVSRRLHSPACWRRQPAPRRTAPVGSPWRRT